MWHQLCESSFFFPTIFCGRLNELLVVVVYLSVGRWFYDTFTLSTLQLGEDIDMFRCRYLFTLRIVNHNACAVCVVISDSVHSTDSNSNSYKCIL